MEIKQQGRIDNGTRLVLEDSGTINAYVTTSRSSTSATTTSSKMTVKQIRALTGLSQAKFAAKYHIPLATLENWERGIRTAPPYVIELLYFRVAYDVRREKHGEPL